MWQIAGQQRSSSSSSAANVELFRVALADSFPSGVQVGLKIKYQFLASCRVCCVIFVCYTAVAVVAAVVATFQITFQLATQSASGKQTMWQQQQQRTGEGGWDDRDVDDDDDGDDGIYLFVFERAAQLRLTLLTFYNMA